MPDIVTLPPFVVSVNRFSGGGGIGFAHPSGSLRVYSSGHNANTSTFQATPVNETNSDSTTPPVTSLPDRAIPANCFVSLSLVGGHMSQGDPWVTFDVKYEINQFLNPGVDNSWAEIEEYTLTISQAADGSLVFPEQDGSWARSTDGGLSWDKNWGGTPEPTLGELRDS